MVSGYEHVIAYYCSPSPPGGGAVVKLIVGLIGGGLVFVVVLGVATFITNNIVDNLPYRYQVVGYGAGLLLAIAAGWSSFRASQ
jgi:hypothetical protein